MLLLQVSDAIMCLAFLTTLRKAAHAWFKSLQPRSIHSFSQLSDIFQKHFVSSHTRRKNSARLLNVMQEKNESLSHYLGRFNAATLEIDDLDESHEIEALIKCGHLKKYIAHIDDRREATTVVEGREDRQENAGTINTISRGIAAGGSSGRGLKAYTREVCKTSQSLSKKQKTTLVPIISFSEDEIGDIKTPHDDSLVVTLRVGNFDVKRIFVDNGSSAEVLFYEAFQKMNISSDQLRKMDTPLYGFSNHPVAVEGIITLTVTIGTPPTQAKLITTKYRPIRAKRPSVSRKYVTRAVCPSRATELGKQFSILCLQVFDLLIKLVSLAFGCSLVSLSGAGHLHRHRKYVMHLAAVAKDPQPQEEALEESERGPFLTEEKNLPLLLERRNPSREGRRQRNFFQKLDYAFFCHLVPLLICGEPSVFIKFIFGFILDFPKSISTGKQSADLGSRSSYLTSMS
ncbi:hypothetical protein RJ639_006321 [Escallonia herrerae]|uniref:Retrotransposon gag domain-containing protein n=1 Tax=Escallonia herrerae TaxID=1293975 RepID=A0AA89AZS9_9ASTE|nr:hypothetical protein RJ639_006321 [Escallonia herrerae]